MDFLVDWLIDYYGPIPYLAIYGVLVACGLGFPIPEDIILIAAGVLSYYGVCDVRIIIVVAFLGVISGDSIIFWLGHHFGRKLIYVWPFRLFLSEEKLNSTRKRLDGHHHKVLFVARFMPGFRASVFFTSGVLHIPFRTMITVDSLAAMISVPTIVYTVYHFGDWLENVVKMIKKVEGGVAITLGSIVALVLARFLWRYFQKRSLAKKRDNTSNAP